MSDDHSPRRIIANTTHDELLGRMIERGDMILRQSEESRRSIEALNGLMGSMQVTLAKLDVTVKNMGDALASYRQLDDRMRAVETSILKIMPDIASNTRFRETLVKYGIYIAVAAIAGGGTVGNLITKAMGWH